MRTVQYEVPRVSVNGTPQDKACPTGSVHTITAPKREPRTNMN